MRSSRFLWATTATQILLACAAGTPTPAVRQSVAPAMAPDASAPDTARIDFDASVPPPPAADPASHLAEVLRPSAGEAVLLLGLHLERIEGYGPMFSSEGVPRTDTRPGYVTVVIRTHQGTADVAGVLPFLAVPQPGGFVYVGESSVRIHLPDDPRVTMYDGTPMPRTWDATNLWKTSNRKAVGATARGLEARLKAARKWGAEDTTQLVYVTPNAWCTVHTASQVTGGALYFHATTTYAIASLDGPALSNNLLAYVGETTFRRFASALFSIKPEEVDFEKPYRDGFMTISWLDDVQVVMRHAEAAVMLEGGVLRAGNSARYFMQTAPAGLAPESLAPATRAVDYPAIVAAIPGTKDAFVSPSNDVVLSLAASEAPDAGADGGTDEDRAPDHIVVWDVAGKKAVGRFAVAGRPVMAEWSEGERARSWLTALSPLGSMPGR